MDHNESPPSMDAGDWTADEWEAYFEAHPDEVMLVVDENYEIHSLGHDSTTGQLSFTRGGRYGYDYAGSRASLEAFVEDAASANKLIQRDEEYAERQRLIDGEYETVQEWVQDD